jgi:RimJ/RimL family protein N-acetyltransferase
MGRDFMFGSNVRLADRFGKEFWLRTPTMEETVYLGLSAILHEPGITQHTSISNASPERAKRDLDYLRHDEGSEAWLVYVGDQLAGFTYLAEYAVDETKLRHMAPGMFLSTTYQSRGIGTTVVDFKLSRAFEHWGCDYILEDYAPDNERTAKILARLGFVAIGRETAKREDGTPLEVMKVSLSRKSWLSR